MGPTAGMVEAAGPRSQVGLRKGKSPPCAVRRWAAKDP